MTHDIKPSKEHSVLDVKLVIHSTDPDEIADALNELLRPEIGSGLIADYAILHSDQPTIVMSSSSPMEGEIFNKINQYTVCVQDAEYNEEWVKVETELQLASMDEGELRKILSDKIVLGQEDKIFVGCVNAMQRITLTE